ncbi:activin receptor type-2B-like isoform X2 [Contarinia nasturtii]|uniref:activin receptor type-2B-like isoform X2 n=1 Tax=Contarinia nasturtii TaxID=265458 RepID=UPI0012D389A6|nr:activin receptor type-2B-like isoform X2 [Contarinia nasturtii]
MLKCISLVLIIGAVGITVATANVLKGVDCECFNTTQTSSQDVCQDNVVRCVSSESDRPGSCFALWATDNLTGETYVKMKGCFTDSACNNTECIANEPKKMNFCCCTGHMCNSKYKLVPTTTKPPKVEENIPQPDDMNIYKIVIIVFGFLVIVGFIIFFVSFYKNKKNAMFNEIPTNEPDAHGSNAMLAQNRPIHLLELKARGRFGAVWRAQLKPEGEVAVKVFPLQEKDSWITEQSIFNLARMKHPNILEFIGVEKHLDKSEYWLITAYHSHGSLCDYLKAHTVTWPELCKIAESMARGLMHLHEEIPASKTDGLKPAVAHRDFKSKNVLLKYDLTACIADFGLALVFQPDVPCGDTHGQVGTQRYMAPEVLEGAINFTRDAFLRIDVYACALVLWELVSRCTAHGGPVTEYTLPFEIELGLRPTLDAMQEHIVTNKNRPPIPEHWRDHSGLAAMCNTMEECWDHDAEARLTASCVIERISQHTRYTKTELLIETNTDTPTKDLVDSIK